MRRLGMNVCSPSAAEICREIVSDGAACAGARAWPMTRCTCDVARCSCRRGESAWRQCAASDEKTMVR